MAWELDEAVNYYRRQGAPADQNAVISLLREIQQEQGSISHSDLEYLAQSYNTKKGLFLALIKRIPPLRLTDNHVLELCAGPNCGKHTQLAQAAQKLCGEKVQLKFVPCMRMCGKGPNLKLDGKLYHKADIALLEKLQNEL